MLEAEPFDQEIEVAHWGFNIIYEIERKGLSDEDWELIDTLEPIFRLVSHGATELVDGIHLMGCTLNTDNDNIALFRDWYSRCLQYHGTFCDLPRYLPEGYREMNDQFAGTDELVSYAIRNKAADLRLLDVEEARLVLATTDARYVALSYARGDVEVPKLSMKNESELSKKHGLSGIRLPQTMRDAIELTKLLGERYLWIDSLCILQDSFEEMRRQILQMDAIYLGANLTVAACGGRDAEAGLPGLSGAPRNETLKIVEIEGQTFVVIPDGLSEVLDRSKWYSRGWTYQELMLSKRLMLFTEREVYFRCKSASFSEDSKLMRVSGGVEVQLIDNTSLGNHGYVDVMCLDENEIPGYSKDYPLQQLTAYNIMAMAFSRRDLAFESDALDAVAGILKVMEETEDASYAHGMPLDRIEWAMLWQSTGPMRRRTAAEGKQPFPSWSWFGWIGEVAYAGVRFIDVHPEVKEWRIQCQIGAEQCTVPIAAHQPYEPGTMDRVNPKFEVGSTRRTLEAETAKAQPAHSLESLLYGELEWNTTLRFVAQHACLRMEVEEDLSSRQFRVMHGKAWIGSVTLDDNDLRKTYAADALFEFAVISSSPYELTTLIPVCDYSRFQEPHGQVQFTDSHPGGTPVDEDGNIESGPVPRLFYNVLILRRVGSMSARAGLGQIHVDGWKLAKSKSLEIALC